MDQTGQSPENDPLNRHRANGKNQAAGAERDKVDQQYQDKELIGQSNHISHLMTSRVENAARMVAATSSWGTRIRRMRAMTDSTTPMTTASSSMEMMNSPQSRAGLPVEYGSARWTKKAPSTNSLSAAPYWISAKAG